MKTEKSAHEYRVHVPFRCVYCLDVVWHSDSAGNKSSHLAGNKLCDESAGTLSARPSVAQFPESAPVGGGGGVGTELSEYL